MSISSSTVALVTGGSRGIGFATAAALLARGASVAITGTDERRLEDARVWRWPARAPAPACWPFGPMSATRPTSTGPFARVVAEWGGLDLLVNNAGVGGFVEVAAMTSADWHRVIDTNLTGVYHCCHAAIPHLKARGGGWIINVSSLAASNPFVGGAAYCASKAGLNAFSEALMQEVRHDGIRVSVVMPGSVRPGSAAPATARAPTGSWRPTTSRRSSWIWSRTPRAACRAASRFGRPVLRGNDTGDRPERSGPPHRSLGELGGYQLLERIGAGRAWRGVSRARHGARPNGRGQTHPGGADRRRRASRAAARHIADARAGLASRHRDALRVR